MLTVTSGVDMLRQFRHDHLEPRLNGTHDLLICLRRDKRYRETLRSKPTSTTVQTLSTDNYGERCINVPNTMQVAISIRRTIVVNDDVHALDINATTEDIGGNEYTLFESLESSVTVDTLRGNNIRPLSKDNSEKTLHTDLLG